MLKGHVFKQQIFGNQIFALFINTFLNGENGISNNYKNAMKVTYNGSALTIQNGVVCIQGRFLEEDTNTNIIAGTDTAFCKLVIEIDLDKQNAETNFAQATYKIIKSTSGYPSLTQTDIIKNNSGIYQYELARFRTTSSGITDFQDMRTYLDFNSIYGAIKKEYKKLLDQLKQELLSVENESAFLLKTDMLILTGEIVTPVANSGTLTGHTDINYPDGWNRENCLCVSVMGGRTIGGDGKTLTTIMSGSTSSVMMGSNNIAVTLESEYIRVRLDKLVDAEQSRTIPFKVLLIRQ